MESAKRSMDGDDTVDQTNKRKTSSSDSPSDLLVCDSFDHSWHWQKDFYPTKGACKISLWKRPVKFLASIRGRTSKKPKREGNTHHEFDHWAVSCHWDDILTADISSTPSRDVTYEAVSHNKLLTPMWSDGSPDDEPGWTCITEYTKTLVLSPADINKAADNLTHLNGKDYHISEMNCQRWVKALWDALTGETLECSDLASSSYSGVANVFYALNSSKP